VDNSLLKSELMARFAQEVEIFLGGEGVGETADFSKMEQSTREAAVRFGGVMLRAVVVE
jgi:hypothetical protein